MRPHSCLALAGCLAALLLSAGCDGLDKPDAGPKLVIPPGVAGTVGEYADLVGGDQLLVRGAGVVVGLGKAGDSAVPDQVRNYLIQQMLKHFVGSPTAGAGNLLPKRMLADPDTAVVLVEGYIPPAAPAGSHFDIFVQTWPQTQTQWLDGGTLMSSDLRLALSTDVDTAADAKTWAVGRGEIFVNPFAQRGPKAELAKLRAGRVPNGGTVALQRPVRLELRRPDYRLANLIMRQINRRFPADEKVALARSPVLIDLKIPPSWQDDHLHFLNLLLHVGLSGSGSNEEEQARQLTRAIVLPTARYEDIALAWEAIGQSAAPVLRPLYASDNPSVAFAAARTGLRLRDVLAVEPVQKLAQQAGSPVQMAAIRELGKARGFIQAVPTLRTLLGDGNELVRIAAYEALVDHGAAGVIRRRKVGDEGFALDIVPADRDFVVYATVSGPERIVIFGRNLTVKTPTFYCPADELVTINANTADQQLAVYRRVPRDGRMSETLHAKATVEDLVALLGSRPSMAPDGRIEGLGLTYAQVVGVLYGMCKDGHIPARFVLQRAEEVKRIYMSASTLGRPDMPEEEPKSP